MVQVLVMMFCDHVLVFSDKVWTIYVIRRRLDTASTWAAAQRRRLIGSRNTGSTEAWGERYELR
jgi:hypothetical protein